MATRSATISLSYKFIKHKYSKQIIIFRLFRVQIGAFSMLTFVVRIIKYYICTTLGCGGGKVVPSFFSQSEKI